MTASTRSRFLTAAEQGQLEILKVVLKKVWI